MMVLSQKNPYKLLSGGTLLILLLLVASMAQAEVGVVYDPDSVENRASSPYILGIITDDPDPIDIRYWEQLHPQGATRFKVVNPEGQVNGDGNPSVLLNSFSGLPIVAWARNSASGYDVVISYFANGTWSLPQVLADSPADELDPHLVLDPSNGDVHIFYWIEESTPRVMHRQAPADLSSWADPVQVSEPGEAACRPTGVFHEGVLHVAYEVHDYGFEQAPRQVVVSRRVGAAFIPEVVAITYNPDRVWPQVHSHSGRIWVDWVDTVDEMAWTRMDGSGQWEPTQYESYQGVEERDFLVRGAIRMKAIR